MEKRKRSLAIDILNGPMWDKILRYALPVAATGILGQLFNASDIAIVGNFAEGEERMIEHVALRCAIEELPEKERKTLYLRYYHGFTQEKTAKVLGVSQVQISRLERKAIAQLREMLS